MSGLYRAGAALALVFMLAPSAGSAQDALSSPDPARLVVPVPATAALDVEASAFVNRFLAETAGEAVLGITAYVFVTEESAADVVEHYRDQLGGPFGDLAVQGDLQLVTEDYTRLPEAGAYADYMRQNGQPLTDEQVEQYARLREMMLRLGTAQSTKLTFLPPGSDPVQIEIQSPFIRTDTEVSNATAIVYAIPDEPGAE